MASKRQRDRKKLRAKIHQAVQRVRRKPRVYVDGEEVKGIRDVQIEYVEEPLLPAHVAQYQRDSDECWTEAKRRRQGKLKTWAIWQRKMEGKGYFFRADKEGVLSVFKDGREVGEVAVFGKGPDATS